MQLVCDLEVHSKYARAVSRNMTIPEMAKWAKWKGITLLGTGDFTHPAWQEEVREHLEEDGTGLLKLRDATVYPELRFMLTGEVSSIFSQGGRGRRIHTIIVAPSFVAAEAISAKLTKHGKLASDGRPMLGVSCKQILTYVLEVNQALKLKDWDQAFIIPAHVWTPWFGLYGSKSGFDSLEECFEELTPHVKAIETGLSSDLPMNWRLSANDKVALVSFSDAHSAPNLMREATVIEVDKCTYAQTAQALQTPTKELAPSISYTLEFFPEEGKYHYDGIATEKLRLHPKETAALRQTDPKLAKKVTVGVLSRVEELADRPEGFVPTNRPDYRRVIPLQEIIADVRRVGKQSKRVQQQYQQLVDQVNEFDILLNLSANELDRLTDEPLTQAILAVRLGQVQIEPGYDGIYGTINIPKNQ